jgi:hypothetical protein
VDETIETENYKLLIEIDFGNYTKLIVGQYTLLNTFFESGNIKKEPILIVIHFYNRNSDKPHNIDRTNKNLGFISSKVLNNNGIKFLTFNTNV